VDFPTINLPTPLIIETVKIPLPTADVPSYTPLVVPPSDLREPEGTQPAKTEEVQPQTKKLDIPIIDIQMPLPSPEVMVTAVTTAVAAVATTTLAQPFFDVIKKRAQKFLQGKIDKWKKKRKVSLQK
tara:strand:+ start:115 stop:495 length:381 start_codon:yes stop_codon:yes gene_type:complete